VPLVPRAPVEVIRKGVPSMLNRQIPSVGDALQSSDDTQFIRLELQQTVAILRHILNVAIEAGVIYSNPAAALKRAAIRAKDPPPGAFIIVGLIYLTGCIWFGIKRRRAKETKHGD
jgi:hypothetical protein